MDELRPEDFPYIEDYRWDSELEDYVLVSRRPNPKYKGKPDDTVGRTR